MGRFKLYLTGRISPAFKLETDVSATDREHALQIAARTYGWLKLDHCVGLEQ